MNLKRLRALRVFLYFALLLNAVACVLDALAGSLFIVVTVVMMASLAVSIRVQGRTIRRREHLDRPRPDYAAIARMEREVYGEAFRHEGASAFTLSLPGGKLSRMGEYGTPVRTNCIGCGFPHTKAGGRCSACYQQWKRNGGPRRGAASVTVTYTTNGEGGIPSGGGAGGYSSVPNLPHPGGSGGTTSLNPFGPIAAHLRGLPVGWPEEDEPEETDHA